MPVSLSDFEDDVLLLATLSQQFVVMLAAYALMDFTFFLSIDEVGKRRRRIPRCALSNPRYSSVKLLLASRNEQAYITVTGLDVATFEFLLVRFEVLYNRYSPYVVDGKVVPLRHERGTKAGRPRTFDAASCLALILCYTRTHRLLFGLELMYGATHSVLVVFQIELSCAKWSMVCDGWVEAVGTVIRRRHGAKCIL
jgi:hypothetical protein